MKFFRWAQHLLGTLPSLPRQSVGHVCSIPEGRAILCESCRHFVEIPRFIPALVGDGATCPRCNNKKKERLKLAISHMRTDAEQKAHLDKRRIKGWVKAINRGAPLPLPKNTEQDEDPKGAA